MVGWNGRMDGIQAAALSIKLKRLAAGNEKRRQHAAQYSKLLGAVETLILPTIAEGRTHVFHIYAVRTARRDDLMTYLGSKNIGCGIHYPVPVHLQQAYAHLGHKRGSFPISERCADEFVSLPMFPELTEEQINYVCKHVTAWARPVSAPA